MNSPAIAYTLKPDLTLSGAVLQAETVAECPHLGRPGTISIEAQGKDLVCRVLSPDKKWEHFWPTVAVEDASQLDLMVVGLYLSGAIKRANPPVAKWEASINGYAFVTDDVRLAGILAPSGRKILERRPS